MNRRHEGLQPPILEPRPWNMIPPRELAGAAAVFLRQGSRVLSSVKESIGQSDRLGGYLRDKLREVHPEYKDDLPLGVESLGLEDHIAALRVLKDVRLRPDVIDTIHVTNEYLDGLSTKVNGAISQLVESEAATGHVRFPSAGGRSE